jgi:hypothetical protein
LDRLGLRETICAEQLDLAGLAGRSSGFTQRTQSNDMKPTRHHSAAIRSGARRACPRRVATVSLGWLMALSGIRIR